MWGRARRTCLAGIAAFLACAPFAGPAAAQGEADGRSFAARTIDQALATGDGRTRETAFVVGGNIEAEYHILRMMGLQPQMQALVTVRGCRFDVLTGRDPDTGQTRQLHFKLARDLLGGGGTCVLQSADGTRQ